MLDYMFKERSKEEDAIINLETELKKHKKAINSRENEYINSVSKLSERIDNITKENIDLSFIEKGLYIQMLALVGRVKDAEEIAEDWIKKYEEVNTVNEPTQKQKKVMEENIEELKKSLSSQSRR